MLTKVDWPGKGTLAFAEGNSIFFFFHFFVVVAVIIVVGCFLFSVFVYFCQGLFKLSNLFVYVCFIA